MAISRSGRIQLAVLGVNVAFWGAILGWTVMLDEDDVDPPDHLDDRAYAAAAEPVCAAALDDIDALGLDPVADSATERADIVAATNAELTEMIDELAAIPRPDGQEGEWVGLWLDDWRQHIADRQRWADRQREGIDEPFTESDRGGEQLSKVIDHFAEVNDMDSCATTHDV